jgi:hypothetical protein
VASGSAGVSFWDKHHDKFINVAEREGSGVTKMHLKNFVLVMFYPFPATLLEGFGWARVPWACSCWNLKMNYWFLSVK